MVTLREIAPVLAGQTSGPDRLQIATVLGLPEDAVPAGRLQRCHLRQGPQGPLLGGCPKVPADRDAKVGDHRATTDPSQIERVVGSLHQPC